MKQPFILITTHAVQEGQLDRLKQLNQEYVRFLADHEPHPFASHLYLSDDGAEATNVTIQPDAAAMEWHLQVAGERLHEALAIAETTSIHVFGTPGPVLQTVLLHHQEAGVPVTVADHPAGGVTRAEAG